MIKIAFLFLLAPLLLFAKEFTLQSIEGEVYHVEITPLSMKIKEFPNRVIILDFFGANCPPCIAEMPELVKLQNTFSKTVQILGIQSSSKRNNKKMQKFVKEHHLNYPVINLDAARDLIVYAQEYTNWNGALPYKLIYNFDGNISYNVYGMVSWDKLIAILQDL